MDHLLAGFLADGFGDQGVGLREGFLVDGFIESLVKATIDARVVGRSVFVACTQDATSQEGVGDVVGVYLVGDDAGDGAQEAAAGTPGGCAAVSGRQRRRARMA